MSMHFNDQLFYKWDLPVLYERMKILRKSWKQQQLSNLKIFKNDDYTSALTETARRWVPK